MRKRKYPLIDKDCPVCGKSFQTSLGHRDEKTVCSVSCSNTHFRSGENNGSWIDGRSHFGGTEARRICLEHWPHKCALCPWDKVIEVHHIDDDHDNNEPENLIPLCPNHHRLTIMNEYKDDIHQQIIGLKC
jgi:hypothetical protein